MYLIPNEFILSTFPDLPLLIAEDFISLKRDLRELNIVEIPVEPGVRSNLIPGRGQVGRAVLPLVSYYLQQLLVFIFRIRSLPYVHV